MFPLINTPGIVNFLSKSSRRTGDLFLFNVRGGELAWGLFISKEFF